MSMITRIALSNLKYNRSKNILTGIAIFLTTLLLFLVPTMGLDLINGQKEAVNELYPTWHGLYRNVDESTADKLSSHHLVERYGLRCDAGKIVSEEADISLMYMDEQALDMNKVMLSKGSLPEKDNEIVVSKGVLTATGQTGDIGNTVTIPYQMMRKGVLDYKETKNFTICGFLEESESQSENNIYAALVSKAFLNEELSKDDLRYRFLFQIETGTARDTDQIETEIKQLAEQFGISEQDCRINEDFLWANYVDPSFLPVMLVIMLIIIIAGVITIYSIYYISMGERVQEFGKIKAIGATTGQLRRIVLTEGLLVACIAIPLGLLTGTLLIKKLFLSIFTLYGSENILTTAIQQMINEGRVSVIIPWVYILAAGVALITVIVSLARPMRIAAKVSEIEAMRFRSDQNSQKRRKGYSDITVGKLSLIHLSGHKKRSLITICSMAVTGLFIMVIATVLTCANPIDAANNSVMGSYEISPVEEYKNKEHPELEWSRVQQNNPLSEELKQQILKIDGVDKVECYLGNYATSESFDGERQGMLGVPESGKEKLEKGIVDGYITYDELKAGDKVIIDKRLLHWYPDLKVGDVLNVQVQDGNETVERRLEIAAIGDYELGMTNYCCLIMAEEGLRSFSSNNLNMYYHVYGKEKYDSEVEAQLNEIVEENGRIQMSTWKASYDEWKSSMTLTRNACYAFLGILGAICIMNMINTIINSVHIRKKELGMLQAIGLSDGQLMRMLQLEGLFYTLGTLIVSVGGGSLAAYPVFLWARKNAMFNIRYFHYPLEAAIVMTVVLILVQVVLVLLLSRHLRKNSIIERIRFEN